MYVFFYLLHHKNWAKQTDVVHYSEIYRSIELFWNLWSSPAGGDITDIPGSGNYGMIVL